MTAHLPTFASYGWPNYQARTFLLLLGVGTFINAWSAFRSTGQWQAAATVFGVRLWTAAVFVGMGWLRKAFPEFAAAADHFFKGPIGYAIVVLGVVVVIWSLLTLWAKARPQTGV